MKVVLHKSYGGFGLSKEAMKYLTDRGYVSPEVDEYLGRAGVPRNHPDLVELVAREGMKASDDGHSRLVVEEVDDFWDGSINDYDGKESVVANGEGSYRLPMITPHGRFLARVKETLRGYVGRNLTEAAVQAILADLKENK